VKRAAVVICGRAQVVQVHYHGFATGQRNVARSREATDPVVERGSSGCVIDVNQLIGKKVWIKRDAEQSAFT
jgi:hypothetical protein